MTLRFAFAASIFATVLLLPLQRPGDPRSPNTAAAEEATAKDSATKGDVPADPLFEEALSLSKRFDPNTDAQSCRAAFAVLAAQVRDDLAATAKEHGRSLTARETIAILNERVLAGRKVRYLSRQYWRDSLFTSALEKKTGNCVSTSLLYYLVGRRLALPIRLAVAPEHLYVCWESADERHNIETTAGGRIVPQIELLRRHEIDEHDRGDAGFGRALTDDEAHAELLKTWSDTAAMLDDDKAALRMMTEAQALWPRNRVIALHRANQLRSRGRHKEAEAIARKVLEGTVSSYVKSTAGYLLSNILETTGHFEEAISSARAAMRYAGPRQLAMLSEQLGRLYRHKREFDRAIAYHQIAADLRDDASGYASLGSVLTEAGRDKEAISAYERSIERNPEDVFPRVILAGLYERTGDREKGRRLFASLKAPRGDTLTWLGALIWYYAVIGNDKQLLVNMEAALKADPSGAIYQYLLREPDLDPYREKEPVAALLKKYRPKR